MDVSCDVGRVYIACGLLNFLFYVVCLVFECHSGLLWNVPRWHFICSVSGRPYLLSVCLDFGENLAAGRRNIDHITMNYTVPAKQNLSIKKCSGKYFDK